MSIQTYKDLSLIFGPPAGKFYDYIVSASEQTGISRCEIYEDMLFESFDGVEEKGLFNQIFSSVIGEDLTIGEIFRTKQTFIKTKTDIEKLVTNPDEQTFIKTKTDIEKLVTNPDEWVFVPVLMFFPSQFQTPPGDPIKNVVTVDHLQVVGATMCQSFKLDWVQSIGVNDTQVA
jgi:hypothetical protein